jgi:SAM-dependent methyltransferase
MSDNFYKAFEDRYRGSRDNIKARQSAYLPFLAPLARLHAPATALDLGCGRGEWLELVAENGFAARGIDLDDGMLSACRARGLQVETADALVTLRALPANSVSLVSAFHLVEHIPFDAVQELIREALRALQPGGLLIMETPNPENLSVGAHSFYRDPSHLRPLPPELLLFAAEFGGFSRQRIVRLQEDPALRTAGVTRLQHVLDGVSPDYAVVAQKAAAPDALAAFDPAFALDFGVSFEAMAQRFDRQEELKSQSLKGLSGGLKELESHVVPLVERRNSADEEILRLFSAVDANAVKSDANLGELKQLEHHLNGQREVMEHRMGTMENRLLESEVRAEAHARKIIEMMESRSWRITAPLRSAGATARRLRDGMRNGTMFASMKWRLRGVLHRVGQKLLRNSVAKRTALFLLLPFPRLRARLRGVMLNAMLEVSVPAAEQQPDEKLSPRARLLVGQLQQAFKQKDQ